MNSLSHQIHAYLELMRDSTLLVSDRDKANMEILITMLGPVDKDIISTRYGLFGAEMKPLDAIARQHRVTPQTIEEILEKDFRKLAITPEWQMMVQTFSPLVKKKIGIQQ
ncbi:MAG: RNA polymerase subunit sigma [Prevotella sp.]|nr:RNA polymerase subunit sigma [Prevotella sp.]